MNKIENLKVTRVLHEIKVQVVELEGADGKKGFAIYIDNNSKVPFTMVDDMLNAAIISNKAMEQYIIKNS